MSVVSKSPVYGYVGEDGDPHGVQPGTMYQEELDRGAPCFYCYEPLTDPSVMWRGQSGEIFLHPACVMELMLRLLRDVYETELKSGLNVRMTPLRVEK
jgi:hypothetical protein